MSLWTWLVNKFRKPKNCWISFHDGEHLYVNENGKRWIDIRPTNGAKFERDLYSINNRWEGSESGMFS